MRPPAVATLLLSALVSFSGPVAAQVAPADSADLVALSQRLMDGITSGDTVAWAGALAPDWFLTDEEGNHLDRSAQLAYLHPLPSGQTGTITVTHPRFTGAGDVAVISYDADEVHHYYGQTLVTTFHATDTYVRRAGRWQQIASQVTALPRVVTAVPLRPGAGAEYVGTYALTSEIQMDVAVQDSGLVLVRPGRPGAPLKQLTPGIFVRDHVRGFWVFTRDGSGKVTGLVDWRDNNAVVWTRRR